MKQLNVFCEGRTEQGFCAQVLAPHLFPQGDGIVHTLAVGERDHHHVYGIGKRTKYARVRKFIINTINQRAGDGVYFTTLFDVYGLPSDFPGKAETVRIAANPMHFVLALESAFATDIGHYRFIPYLQLHEYETMLFAAPDAFRRAFENCDEEIQRLNAIAASEPSIEHINDGVESAPSKRIIAIIPEYGGRKASAGPDIAEYIGIPRIREKCMHFHQWLMQLENIAWEREGVVGENLH